VVRSRPEPSKPRGASRSTKSAHGASRGHQRRWWTILANAGDAVKPGQVRARLHSHEVHESRADYQKRWLNGAPEVRRELRTARPARARRLLELKAASVEQVEHAESDCANAQAALSNAEWK
jgi:cobalt-zinc-cadmium efflux system membrane fusion protein